MSSVVLPVFQCWYPHTFIMQLTVPLHRAADKATSKIWRFLPPLYNGNDFSSGYVTFDISTAIPSVVQYRKQIKSNHI